MPITKLASKAALVSAVGVARLPVAVLVGTAIAADNDGGVPGVRDVLRLIEAEVQASAPHHLADYQAAIVGKDGGDAYQTAMEWLQAWLTQDAVNHVITQAVLQARKPGAPTTFAYDGVVSDWHLPAGVQQLGDLVCGYPDRFPGPILTTNFDPLISLAIEGLGGRNLLRVVDSDGSLPRYVETGPGATQIVHLHGYWRDAQTLHTVAQLTNPRPKLMKSLQEVLRQRTLLVVAYGGWDDVFARALADWLDQEEAKVNVFWCFRETDVASVNARYGALFARVNNAITSGRFVAYGGVDCHSIFGEIAAARPGRDPQRSAPSSGLAGWQSIDSAYLDGLAPLEAEGVVRYFDGAEPTWRHAVSAAIPRRGFVAELAQGLTAARTKTSCSMRLIRAAGGEGKTTLLLQAAADAVRAGWSVLWRPSPQIGLSAKAVMALDPGRQWLVVADDAENLVADLVECAQSLSAAGRTHVHFLLAARDPDWRVAKGDSQPFGTYLRYDAPVILRGLTTTDAKAIVDAWRGAGESGLRGLAKYSGRGKQVDALFNAVRAATNDEREGSLFGGLLAVRFGREGLRAHVRQFIARLQTMTIKNSDHSLLDALLYIAACHAAGIPGLNENVLADLVGVPRHWVRSDVVWPLGEEAVIGANAGYVFTRHRQVAGVILDVAEESFGLDIAERWAALVHGAVKTGRDIHFGDASFPRIVHAGPRLESDLPAAWSDTRRRRIAIAAAKADVEAEPERLSPLVDLGRTYRVAGDVGQAAAVFRQHHARLASRKDFKEGIRGYWYEWGICEGFAGVRRTESASETRARQLIGCWLQGMALSDHLPVPVSDANVKYICSGVGAAFGHSSQRPPRDPYALGRRAAGYLGMLLIPDIEMAGEFRKTGIKFESYARDADTAGVPHPKHANEAIDWLAAAIAAAGRDVRDEFIRSLAVPDKVTFQRLRDCFKTQPRR